MELTKKFNEIPQVFNCEIEYESHENEYVVSFMYKNKFETALVIGDGYHEMLVGKYVPECGLMIPDIQKAVEKNIRAKREMAAECRAVAETEQWLNRYNR